MAFETYNIEFFLYTVGFDTKEMYERKQFSDVVHHGCTTHGETCQGLQFVNCLSTFGGLVLDTLCLIKDDPESRENQ